MEKLFFIFSGILGKLPGRGKEALCKWAWQSRGPGDVFRLCSSLVFMFYVNFFVFVIVFGITPEFGKRADVWLPGCVLRGIAKKSRLGLQRVSAFFGYFILDQLECFSVRTGNMEFWENARIFWKRCVVCKMDWVNTLVRFIRYRNLFRVMFLFEE